MLYAHLSISDMVLAAKLDPHKHVKIYQSYHWCRRCYFDFLQTHYAVLVSLCTIRYISHLWHFVQAEIIGAIYILIVNSYLFNSQNNAHWKLGCFIPDINLYDLFFFWGYSIKLDNKTY